MPAEADQYDQWGNLKITPIKTIEENHAGNFIKIFVYEYNQMYYFSFQLKIEKLIRQRLANIDNPPMQSIEKALQAARNIITDICRKNHTTKRIFEYFTKIIYDQPELF